MKLYTSTTSPTARAIILTALAQGKDALQLAYADPWTTPPALTVVNPLSQVPVLITVDGSAQWTASTNTPYAGMELPGQVMATFLHGRPTVLDGAPVEAPAGSAPA